jgi:hypothetical protein
VDAAPSDDAALDRDAGRVDGGRVDAAQPEDGGRDAHPADAAPDATETTCPPDSVARNASAETSHRLTADGEIDDLVVCPGADDWFRLDLATGYEMQFDACASGDPPVEVDFYRAELPDPVAHLGGGSASVEERCDGTSIWSALANWWGSAVTVTGTGFLLNDKMLLFTPKPGAPTARGIIQGENNAISAGRRPVTQKQPTIVLDPRGDLEMVLGGQEARRRPARCSPSWRTSSTTG